MDAGRELGGKQGDLHPSLTLCLLYRYSLDGEEEMLPAKGCNPSPLEIFEMILAVFFCLGLKHAAFNPQICAMISEKCSHEALVCEYSFEDT